MEVTYNGNNFLLKTISGTYNNTTSYFNSIYMPWIGNESMCIYLSKNYLPDNVYFYDIFLNRVRYYKGGIRYSEDKNKLITFVYTDLFVLTASIGSDPHVYTIFGSKYDLEPSVRKWYNIFRYEKLEINGHFSPIGKGLFFNKVNIKRKDDIIKINFNKKSINNEVKKKWIDVKYKDDGIIIENRRILDLIKIEDKDIEMEIYIDFHTRYLHFRIKNIKNKDNCRGLIVENNIY
jgi:hypothetical protein